MNPKINTRLLVWEQIFLIKALYESCHQYLGERKAADFSLCWLNKLVIKAIKLGSGNNLVLNFQMQLLR